MKPVMFSDHARIAMEKAKLHYERDAGAQVVERFAESVKDAATKIGTNPTIHPRVWKQFRKRLLGDFPFRMIFEEFDDFIYVVAFEHTARNPNRWKSRVH